MENQNQQQDMQIPNVEDLLKLFNGKMGDLLDNKVPLPLASSDSNSSSKSLGILDSLMNSKSVPYLADILLNIGMMLKDSKSMNKKNNLTLSGYVDGCSVELELESEFMIHMAKKILDEKLNAMQKMQPPVQVTQS